MISNYSTFIQIIAALYLTMSIDNLIYKRFWSPDYKNLVLSKLKIFKQDTSIQLGYKLSNSLDKKQHYSEHDARIWGLHFCLFSFILLIFCGYEQDYIKDVIKARVYMGIPLLVFFISMFISTCVLFFLKKRCICVVISCVIYSALTLISIIVSRLCDLQFLCNNKFFEIVTQYIEFFIIFLLVIPVLIQLLKLWVVTKGYSFLIEQNFTQELAEYRKALGAIKNNRPSDMPSSYHEASTAALCATSGSSDNEDTKISNGFFGVLVKHLTQMMEEPSFGEQVKAAFRNLWYNNEDETKNYSVEEETEDVDEIPTPEAQTNDVIEKYRDSINEYNKLAGVKIKSFCSERNINETEFRYARNELKKKEK